MATVKKLTLTAPTVDDALARARAKYPADEYDISYEILEMPSKGFFGIGAKPAKVVVTARPVEPEVALDDIMGDLHSLTKISVPDPDPEEEEPLPETDDGRTAELAERADKLLQSIDRDMKPQQNQPKRSEKQKQQNQPKQSQPKQEPKPEAPKPAPKQEPKPEAPKQEPKAAELSVGEMRERPKTAALPSEDELPAALRTPVKRPNQPKKKEKKTIVRPQDDRTADEKKHDLLSAVMGIAAPAPGSTENVVTPAQPRAERTYDPEEVKPVEIPTRAELKGRRPRGDRPERDRNDRKDRRRNDRGDRGDRTERAEKTPAPAAEAAAEPVSTGRIEFATPAEMEAALTFINTLLANMKLESRATAVTPPEGTEVPEGMVYAKIDIAGPDTTVLIGHHGDTLDSIQYLVNLAGSKGAASRKDYVKIVVDVENYRAKREETLRQLARRMAAKAVRTKRNVVLEPMNPYERRIIHSELHGVENVSTHSVGSDEDRKVIVTYEGADARVRSPRGESRRGGKKKPSRVILPPDDGDVADAETIAREIAERAARRNDRFDHARAKSLDEIDLGFGVTIPPSPDEENGEAAAPADAPVADAPKIPNSSVLDDGVEPDAPNLDEGDAEQLHEF